MGRKENGTFKKHGLMNIKFWYMNRLKLKVHERKNLKQKCFEIIAVTTKVRLISHALCLLLQMLSEKTLRSLIGKGKHVLWILN